MEIQPLKEGDHKKALENLKYELMCLSQYPNNLDKKKQQIYEYYQPSQSKILRSLQVPLLKSLYSIEFDQLNIASDIQSQDSDLQINALKILPQLKINEQIDVLRMFESDIIDLANSNDFNTDKVMLIHSFLWSVYFVSFENEKNDEIRELIISIYIKFAKLCFQENRDISRNLIEVFIDIFQSYHINQSEIITIQNQFQGWGGIKQMLKTLVLKVFEYLILRIDQLSLIINSCEVYLRSHLQKLLVYLLDILFEVAPQTTSVMTVDQQKICINRYIQDLIEIEIIHNIFNYSFNVCIIENCINNAYQLLNTSCNIQPHIRENIFNQIQNRIEKLLPQIPLSNIEDILLQITLQNCVNTSERTLNLNFLLINFAVQHLGQQYIVFRSIITISCLYQIIKTSQTDTESNQPSFLYKLYEQNWFINIVNNNSSVNLMQTKEEIVICLCFAALNLQSSSQLLQVEVLDIAYSLINWKFSSKDVQQQKNDFYYKIVQFSIEVYLILLEQVLNQNKQKNIQINLHLDQIIKRINGNEITFNGKIRVLNSICKYNHISPILKLNFKNILIDFQKILMIPLNPKTIFSKQFIKNLPNQVEIIKFLQKLEIILNIIFQIGIHYEQYVSEIKASVMNLLVSFSDHLQKICQLEGNCFILYLYNRKCKKYQKQQ